MSLLNQDFIQRLQEQLLSTDEATCRFAIDRLNDEHNLSQLLPFYPLLEIISQLNPHESIRQAAQKLLAQSYSEAELQFIANTFAIFHSMEEFLPWDNANNIYIQIDNYNTFHEEAQKIVPIMCQGKYYKDKLQNLAQQLYILYDLKDMAIEILEQVLQYDSNNAEAYYALGRIVLQKGEKFRAIALFESCLSIDEAHYYALTTLAPLADTVLNRSSYAISLYEKAIAIEPFSADLYAACAALYYKEKEFARAQQFIEIALGINPVHTQALIIQGQYYIEIEEDYQKAIEVYEKGLDDPILGDNPLLAGKLASLYTKYLLEYDKAKIYYEKALHEQPNQPEVLVEYVNFLMEVYQDRDVALNLLLNFEKNFGTHPLVQDKIQKIQPQPTFHNEVDGLEAQIERLVEVSLNNTEEDEDEWIGGDSASDE